MQGPDPIGLVSTPDEEGAPRMVGTEERPCEDMAGRWPSAPRRGASGETSPGIGHRPGAYLASCCCGVA